MSRATITIVIFILILAGVLGYVYYKYERPFHLKDNYSNISIISIFEGKKIKTGYIVETSQGTIEGNTSQAYELISVPREVIKIKNINLESQEFYIEEKLINVTNENIRVDFVLSKPQEIIWSLEGSKPVHLNLFSKDFRNLKICAKWSKSFIFVEFENLTEMEKLDLYSSWDKCYDTNQSLLDSNYSVVIDYRLFSELTDRDYFNISVFNDQKAIKIKIK